LGRSGERTAHQLFSMPGKRNRPVRKKRIPQFLTKVNYRSFGLVRILFFLCLWVATHKPDSQLFEHLPTEISPPIKKSTIIPPQKIPRKRNSTLEPFPAKRRSRTHDSRSPGPKYINVSLPTTEISTPNESFVDHTIAPRSELPISKISNLQVPIKSTSATSSVRPTWPNFTPIQTYWLRFGRAKPGMK
jgi:cytoskeletal protein RodZ